MDIPDTGFQARGWACSRSDFLPMLMVISLFCCCSLLVYLEDMVRYQQLGDTGVQVSRLCLGTMTFGGGVGLYEVIGGMDQAETDEMVGHALDMGINFVRYR